MDAVRNRLAPGHEWGIYLDRPALEKFANNSTPDLRRLPKVTSVKSAARWNPEGSRPMPGVGGPMRLLKYLHLERGGSVAPMS